jgi:hypothetical protein
VQGPLKQVGIYQWPSVDHSGPHIPAASRGEVLHCAAQEVLETPGAKSHDLRIPLARGSG